MSWPILGRPVFETIGAALEAIDDKDELVDDLAAEWPAFLEDKKSEVLA